MTTRIVRRRPSPPWTSHRLIGLSAIMLVSSGTAGLAQNPDQPSSQHPTRATSEPGPTADLPAASATLADAGASMAARRAAAVVLMAHPHDSHARAALLDALSSGRADPQGRLAVLLEIAASPVPPQGLWHPVVQLALTETDEALLASVIDAIASFRTRAAAQILLGFTADDQHPQVREAAYAGLARLSGRIELGRDGGAWQRWLVGVVRLSEDRWHDELIRGLAGRIDRQARQRSQIAARLVETYRKLWLGTPADGRSAMLAQLLMDPIDDLRTLGFDLVRQELASAHTLLPVVHEAVMGLLASDDWRVRADAAVLLAQLAPDNAGDRVLAALRIERDPRAAQALLAAMARWPSASARETLIVWLERDESTSQVATQAVWALQREGLIDSDADRARVLAALRFLDDEQFTAPACRLLVALGDPTDHQRVQGLLTSSRAPQRLAAADALADQPGALDAIAAAADTDRALVAALVRGIRAHQLDAQGLAMLGAVRSIPADQRTEQMLALAGDLPTVELLSGGGSVQDPALREAILALLLEPTRRPAEEAPDTEKQAYARGLAALAEARIGLVRFDPAIAAIEALKAAGGEPEQVASLGLLIAALLDADRLDDAQAVGGGAQLWLDQLERLIAAPEAPELARAISQRFTALSPEQLARFDALRARLPTAITDADPASPQPADPPPEDG